MEPSGTPRKPPGRIGRRLARAPIWLYRLRMGWLLGRRFVMVEHTGRRTGRVRRTVLEVVGHEGGAIRVASAWPRSDWYRNLLADPRAQVISGFGRRVPVRAQVLDLADSERVFDRYVTEHPNAARGLSKALDLPFADGALMARRVPVVEFRPETRLES